MIKVCHQIHKLFLKVYIIFIIDTILQTSFTKRKIITISLIIADLIFSLAMIVIEIHFSKIVYWYKYFEIGSVAAVLTLLFIPIIISKRRMTKVFTIGYIIISLLYSCLKITITITTFNKLNNSNKTKDYYDYNFPIILLIMLAIDTFFRIICFISLKFFLIELKKIKMFNLRRKQESFIDKLGNTQEPSIEQSIH